MTAHPTPDVLALIALGEDVGPEIVDHVDACRTCFHEIGALQQVVAIGRSLGPEDRLVEPDPRVWQRIAAEVSTTSVGSRAGDVSVLERPRVGPASATPIQPAPGTTDELAARRRPAARRRWAPVAVAAAAALVVGLGGGYALRGLTTQGSDVTSTQLNALPGYPGANGTATVEDGANGQRTLVVSVALPATIDVNGTMEVWMSDTQARDMVPMGAMGDSTTQRFPIPASFDLATHPIVDISLEPRNDTDPGHSAVSVVRGRLNV